MSGAREGAGARGLVGPPDGLSLTKGFPTDRDIHDEMSPSSFLLSAPGASRRLTIDTHICNSGYLRATY